MLLSTILNDNPKQHLCSLGKTKSSHDIFHFLSHQYKIKMIFSQQTNHTRAGTYIRSNKKISSITTFYTHGHGYRRRKMLMNVLNI